VSNWPAELDRHEPSQATLSVTSRPSGTRVMLTAPSRAVVVVLLLAHAAMLCWGAYHSAPTIEEVAYLPAGLSHWEFGRFDLASVSPPLVRLIAAIPVLFARPIYDWHSYDPMAPDRSGAVVGADFVAANGPRAVSLFVLARLACIPLSVVGGLVCLRWAHGLYGLRAGLLALFIWCFSPAILASGQLMTADVGVTSLGLASSYAFWRWLKHSAWSTCFVAGLTLGVAELAKTNTIVFFVLWPLLWCVSQCGRTLGWHTRLKEACQIVIILVCGIFVINLGYAFEGSFQKLGSFTFQSRMLGGVDPPGNPFKSSWYATVPVPLPSDYVLGLDDQKADFDNGRALRRSFFCGQWYRHGWWWYYFYVLGVKAPLGAWGLLGLTLIYRLRRAIDRSACLSSPCWRDDIAILGPSAAMFALASMQVGFSHHMRYVLPALPYLGIWASQATSIAPEGRAHWSRCLIGVLSCWMFASSLWIWPHSLAYFNETTGGPLGGGFFLQSSNIDWGEDLLYLKRWIERHTSARPLYVYYWGALDPQTVGIVPPVQVIPKSHEARPNTDVAARPRPPGWYAVSQKCLWGDGRFGPIGCESFRALKSDDRVGYSILIFDIPSK
jgi:hypothetical protein